MKKVYIITVPTENEPIELFVEIEDEYGFSVSIPRAKIAGEGGFSLYKIGPLYIMEPGDKP